MIDVYAEYASEPEEVERVRGFESFTPAPLPNGVRRDQPNRCSVTTLKLAAQLDLTAARGYALFRRRRSFRNPRARPVWIGHWWAVAPDGDVIDASWSESGLAYIGERVALRKEPSPGGGFDLSAYTLTGVLITDLGVYVYPPARVAEELERKRAAFAQST